MKHSLLPLLAAALFAVPASAATTTVVETFDGPVTSATWRLGMSDTVETSGGSPGAWLHNPQFEAAVPQPVYVGPQPSPFFGDYRAAGVTSLGLDVNIFSASFGVDHTRALALVLSSDMGTPDDSSDDCDAYFVSHKPLPQPGTGWRSYDFRVPADSTTLPAGWQLMGTCANLPADEAWNRVITNVTRLRFPFSPPATMWFYQEWNLGLDSIRVTFGR